MFTKRRLSSSALTIGLLCVAAQDANAGGMRLVQSTTETRTYVHFKVSGDAIQRALPAGWISSPGTGPLQGANLIVLLVEGLAAANPEGKPVLNRGKFVLWAVPAKNERNGEAGVMVVGGLTSQPQAAPGAYGVYAPARIAMSKSSRSTGVDETAVEESWEAASDAGDAVRFSIAYERGLGVRAHIEPHAHAAIRPDFYRVYKTDQVSDIVHSATDGNRRAAKLEFVAKGPQLARLFDGQEQLVAVTSIPVYSRDILLPE